MSTLSVARGTTEAVVSARDVRERDDVRVLVADDVSTRERVRSALDGHVEICAEADTCPLAVSAACSLRPEVCLIGRSIPGGGITTVREISRSVPETSIVVLSDRNDASGLLSAVRAGAVGYVPAGFDGQALRQVIRSVIADKASVPRVFVRDLVNELRDLQSVAEERLTERELEVLRMLRCGESTTAIARELGISPVTVRRHISKLVAKVGVADRDALVRATSDLFRRMFLDRS